MNTFTINLDKETPKIISDLFLSSHFKEKLTRGKIIVHVKIIIVPVSPISTIQY